MMKLKNPLSFLKRLKQKLSNKTENTPPETPQKSPDFQQDKRVSADDIEKILQNLDYHFRHEVFEYDRDNFETIVHHFSMSISDENDNSWVCLVRFIERTQLLCVYSLLPFSVPKNYYTQMLVMVAHLNYDMTIGNFELDLHDGELRFKTSLDVEATGVNMAVVGYLMQSNLSTTSRFFDDLKHIVEQKTPTDDVQQAFDQILYGEKAQDFFMPSDTQQ